MQEHKYTHKQTVKQGKFIIHTMTSVIVVWCWTTRDQLLSRHECNITTIAKEKIHGQNKESTADIVSLNLTIIMHYHSDTEYFEKSVLKKCRKISLYMLKYIGISKRDKADHSGRAV
jgi:hypothetical protein